MTAPSIARSSRLRKRAARREDVPLHPEIRAADVLVAEEVGAAALERDATVLEHVAAAGQAERLARVLLHEEHRGADAVDLGDDAEDLLHDDGRQAERGLVEHEDARPRHERAADGEHLLLAAR